jgi:hypothetical protein
MLMISFHRIPWAGAGRVRFLLALVFVARAAVSAAQSYGLGDQVLTLGAAAFRPTHSAYDVNRHPSDGYFYGEIEYVAPLTLPDGAEIFQMCLYSYVPVGGTVYADILVSKLVPGGQSPLDQPVGDSVVSDSIPIGYGTVCTNPFSYIFHDLEDVDSDGSPDPIAHVVYADVFTDDSGFGGVRIFWRRQVSPRPNTPTFNDVPADDPSFQYIEALVASGITSGCATNPPRYCPDASLTRRQMAVFLSKALGLHWPN